MDDVVIVDSKSDWKRRLAFLEADRRDVTYENQLLFKSVLAGTISDQISSIENHSEFKLFLHIRYFEVVGLDRTAAARCLLIAYKAGFITPDPEMPGLWYVFPIVKAK